MSGMKYLSPILAIGMLAVTSYGGCATTRRGPEGEIVIPQPKEAFKTSDDPEIAYQQRKNICEGLVEILERDGEFDQVSCHVMEDNGKYNLIIGGCYKEKSLCWTGWRVNMDKICRALHKDVDLLGLIDLSDFVITSQSAGHVIKSPSFSEDAARQVTQIFQYYLQNNTEECKKWAEHHQEHYGPLGPVQ